MGTAGHGRARQVRPEKMRAGNVTDVTTKIEICPVCARAFLELNSREKCGERLQTSVLWSNRMAI